MEQTLTKEEQTQLEGIKAQLKEAKEAGNAGYWYVGKIHKVNLEMLKDMGHIPAISEIQGCTWYCFNLRRA